ncbi:MAG: hypothetical protein LBU47_06115, partial [Christensenellaceae bacterium]|jgi:RNA polymerase sigma factor (sigma-70 family)|nr:hypothetical protein [Christensenellaceae bacterium]
MELWQYRRNGPEAGAAVRRRDGRGASPGEIAGLLLDESRFIHILSLNMVVADRETELWELLPDEDAPSPEELAELSALRSALRAELGRLKPKERLVVERRFGFGGGDLATLAEIAGAFGVTRERIRQIEKRALERVRRAKRIDHLKDFL